MHRFNTKKLVVKVKVEILAVNELGSRFYETTSFNREARLTCPLHRQTEGICIGIYVSKRVFNVWHILKKVCLCNNMLNNLSGKKED